MFNMTAFQNIDRRIKLNFGKKLQSTEMFVKDIEKAPGCLKA